MAKKDIPSINYFKDKTRIADLLNVYLYDGNKIISPQDISELNPILAKSWWNDKELKTNVNITDVLFEVKVPAEEEVDAESANNDTRKVPIIISIQNQSDISYVMPVRVINADANGYYLQWKDIERKHKREKQAWADPGEFLSKFKESDRLKPILTIVIYFGKDNWNGAKSLKEITDLKVCPLHIQKQMQDYSINLIEVRNFSDVEKFTTDLREVFGFLQNDENKQQLEKCVEKHRAALINLEEDAYDLICVMSDMKKLQELKSKLRQEGGCNMCKALEEIIEDETRQRETLVNILYEHLYNDERMGDMKRAFTDKDYRRQLMKEYGLQVEPYRFCKQ
nr:Rpn family recombination-promoting nuclease/putative transposase [uncultured Blautia sp.]